MKNKRTRSGKEVLGRILSEQPMFVIHLEKGEAIRSIFDMCPEEIREVSRQIFQLAKDKAAQIGQAPIVS
jgi:hypothetical protein